MPGDSGKKRNMKAWVLYGINDLRYASREIPKPGTGEALVKVCAAGICGSDIPRIYASGAHVHPIIPGHEFAGVVAECGDASLIGKHVGVFPLIPCGNCPQCRRREYQLCRNYNYLGSRCDGGFAEYAVVPVWNLMPLPEQLPFPLAACLEPLSVAIHAIRRAGITERDSVAVIGLGAIGLLTVSALRAMGVTRVFALGNNAFQQEMVRRLGLPGEAYSDAAAPPPECDAVLECVGKPEALALALRAAAPGGRVVTVGNPSGNMAIPQADYWRILRNQLTILGTWNSSFTHSEDDDWHAALELMENNQAMFSNIVSHQLRFSQLNAGLQIMKDKTEPYGRIVAVLAALEGFDRKMEKEGTLYFFTGLAGAGKSTLGGLFYEHLRQRKPDAVLIDGHKARESAGATQTQRGDYSNAARLAGARVMFRNCLELTRQGHDVVCCSMSLFDEIRDWNRANFSNYKEIYIKTSMEVLRERRKELYSSDRDVVGVHLPWDEPKAPDFVIENDGHNPPEEIVEKLEQELFQSKNKVPFPAAPDSEMDK